MSFALPLKAGAPSGAERNMPYRQPLRQRPASASFGSLNRASTAMPARPASAKASMARPPSAARARGGTLHVRELVSILRPLGRPIHAAHFACSPGDCAPQGQPPVVAWSAPAAQRVQSIPWIFTEKHSALVDGLQHNAPADLQVWARRRKQALRRQSIPAARLKQQQTRHQRSPPPRPQQQAPRGVRPPPALRRPLQPVIIQPQAQSVVLQSSATLKAPPSNLKHPLRSGRQRVLQREMLQQQRHAQRQLQLSRMLRDREEASVQVSAHTVAAAVHEAYRSEVGARMVPGKQRLETRLAELQGERTRGRSAELYHAVHHPTRPPPPPPVAAAVAQAPTFAALLSLDDAEIPAPASRQVPMAASDDKSRADRPPPTPPSPSVGARRSPPPPPNTASVQACTPALNAEPPRSPGAAVRAGGSCFSHAGLDFD